MRGKEVFYPVGWDDNGLATERRVQNYYGVRCDPSRPYQPGFTPPALGNGRALSPADQVIVTGIQKIRPGITVDPKPAKK